MVRQILRACMAVAFFQSAVSCFGSPVVYDPSLSSLPTDQGWLLNGSASPSPIVSGGSMHQGPTAFGGFQYWERSDGVYDTSAGFVADVRLKVVSSTYGAGGVGGTWRTGWQLLVNDSLGRVNILGISDTGVRIANDANSFNSLSSPFITFDTTDAFHTYRLVSEPTGISLLIDGVLKTTLPLGATGIVTPNYTWFGDGTSGGSSETYLQSVVVGAVVPEPSSLIMLVSAALCLSFVCVRGRSCARRQGR